MKLTGITESQLNPYICILDIDTGQVTAIPYNFRGMLGLWPFRHEFGFKVYTTLNMGGIIELRSKDLNVNIRLIGVY